MTWEEWKHYILEQIKRQDAIINSLEADVKTLAQLVSTLRENDAVYKSELRLTRLYALLGGALTALVTFLLAMAARAIGIALPIH